MPYFPLFCTASPQSFQVLYNEGVGSVSIKQILANRLDVTNEGVGSVSIDHAKGDVMKIDNEGVGSVKVGNVSMSDLKVDNEGILSAYFKKSLTPDMVISGTASV